MSPPDNDLDTPTAERARKRFATLQARAALAQVVLLQTTDDYDRPLYVVSRWALCRSFEDLADVELWLNRVTGDQHA